MACRASFSLLQTLWAGPGEREKTLRASLPSLPFTRPLPRICILHYQLSKHPRNLLFPFYHETVEDGGERFSGADKMVTEPTTKPEPEFDPWNPHRTWNPMEGKNQFLRVVL